MAVAGFMDPRPHPIWPRWAAYVNLWVAVTGAGGICAVFLKKGPFSWNGLVGFWIPVIVFIAGMTMTMGLLLRRARYEERSGELVGLIGKVDRHVDSALV
jgi:hypothetical protein